MQEMKKGVCTDMKFDSVKYSFKDAVKSIVRNKTLSIASMATVAATLFILGAITLVVANVDKAVTQLGSMVEARIYLDNDITDSEKKAIEAKINEVEGINSIVYESQEEALENIKGQLNDTTGELTAGFEEDNPFPASYTVNVKKPEIIDNVVAAIKDMDGIEEIKDARSLIEKISNLTNSVKIGAVIGFIVFILISLFLIGNTIKITVFTRKREIGIMKYVGATDWFIRWPLIIEGMILGLVGAIIAGIVLSLGYFVVTRNLSLDLFGFTMIPVTYMWKVVIWELFACGLFIGAVGSVISMRKFLKV